MMRPAFAPGPFPMCRLLLKCSSNLELTHPVVDMHECIRSCCKLSLIFMFVL
jgi:hypothetical protein